MPAATQLGWNQMSADCYGQYGLALINASRGTGSRISGSRIFQKEAIR